MSCSPSNPARTGARSFSRVGWPCETKYTSLEPANIYLKRETGVKSPLETQRPCNISPRRRECRAIIYFLPSVPPEPGLFLRLGCPRRGQSKPTWHGQGRRDGLGTPGRGRQGGMILHVLGAGSPRAREGESGRLGFNCSLLAKANKVRAQRIEVILSEGSNCFFPKGRGGEGREAKSVPL